MVVSLDRTAVGQNRGYFLYRGKTHNPQNDFELIHLLFSAALAALAATQLVGVGVKVEAAVAAAERRKR